MTANKPVDLVVANTMHEAVQAINAASSHVGTLQKMLEKLGATVTSAMPDASDAVARKMLCNISHEVPIAVVMKALASVTSFKTLGDINDGLQAVRDRQTVTP